MRELWGIEAGWVGAGTAGRRSREARINLLGVLLGPSALFSAGAQWRRAQERPRPPAGLVGQGWGQGLGQAERPSGESVDLSPVWGSLDDFCPSSVFALSIYG